jgi:hypothetical protein
MKHNHASLALASALFASSAFAQEATPVRDVTNTLSGTFDSSVPTTSLTAPGDFFKVSFTVAPSVLTTSPSQLLAPILGGFYEWGNAQGNMSHGNVSDSFYSFNSNSGTDFDLNLGSGDRVELSWTNSAPGFIGSLASPPDANGVATFQTGDFGTTGINSFSFDSSSGDSFVLFGQSATVTGSIPPIPEPSTVGLMAIGVLSCGGFAWMRRRQVA